MTNSPVVESKKNCIFDLEYIQDKTLWYKNCSLREILHLRLDYEKNERSLKA